MSAWVKTGKARSEHEISALPLKADIGADIVFIRSVPLATVSRLHAPQQIRSFHLHLLLNANWYCTGKG